MQVVLANAWARRLEGSDGHVESMHPGWVETAGVARYLPTFRKIPRPLLREVDGGADTAVGLVATRPDSKPGHFWHDRAQRPTAFGWQRAEDPAEVAHVLQQVSAMTGTPNEWVVWVRHRIDCLLSTSNSASGSRVPLNIAGDPGLADSPGPVDHAVRRT